MKTTGWHLISQPALVAAGLNPATDPSRLRLFTDGVEVPLSVTAKRADRLDRGDAIEFYGTGIDTPYTDTRV